MLAPMRLMDAAWGLEFDAAQDGTLVVYRSFVRVTVAPCPVRQLIRSIFSSPFFPRCEGFSPPTTQRILPQPHSKPSLPGTAFFMRRDNDGAGPRTALTKARPPPLVSHNSRSGPCRR